MDLRQEARARALQRLDGQRAGNVGGLHEAPCTRKCKCAERGHELRTVDERETFLRLECDRLEAHGGECRRTFHSRAVHPCLALANEREGEMSKRGEIPACADGAAAGDVRENTPIQTLDQELNRLGSCARAA